METETVPCLLCGSEETTLLFQGRGYAMGRCRGCGLVRQNPRFTPQAMIHEYYDGAVQEGGFDWGARKEKGLEAWQPKGLLAYERSVADVDAQRIRSGPKGVWVDVGASTGSLLLAARQAGWPVLGVEPGWGQARICREQHGIEVHHGTLRDAALPDEHAEVLSYRHVLEHIHDPFDELREARRALAPDGLLLVEVPNYDGQRYRWGRVRTRLRLSKPFWHRVNVPEHLYYFTSKTIQDLLRRAGFQTLFVRTYGKARAAPNPLRRLYDASRDGLGMGNSLRVVARPS